jgi:hypothetical protein
MIFLGMMIAEKKNLERRISSLNMLRNYCQLSPTSKEILTLARIRIAE